MSATETQVQGTIVHVDFRGRGGFHVLQVATADGVMPVICFHPEPLAAGETVRASGNWHSHPDYGRQFKAAVVDASAPVSTDGIERYLAAEVPGVGAKIAARLVAAFGEATLAVAEMEPERFQEAGIGKRQAHAIGEHVIARKVRQAASVALHAAGIGPVRIARVFERYGEATAAMLRTDPYRLAEDVDGIGFLTADGLARSQGLLADAPGRLRAGLSHVMQEAAGDGHCGLPVVEAADRTVRLLGVSDELVAGALGVETAAGRLVAFRAGGAPCIFPARLHKAECQIAARLKALCRINQVSRSPFIAAPDGLTLSAGQHQAVMRALVSKVVVITGGPGTGKTTIIRTVLASLPASMDVALCGPTGRAARRLTGMTDADARTVHRLLEYSPRSGGFRRSAENPLDCDVLVIDEASMIDAPLMQALLTALRDDASLVIVGDADQLPSVGPGNVLRDVIASGIVPVVRLTDIFRQAEGSTIPLNAARINRGLMPQLGDAADFRFVVAETGNDAAALIVDLVATRLPLEFSFDPVRDVQVLSPMKRGEAGTLTLNTALQAALNPSGSKTEAGAFRIGDRVMQTINDYDRNVFNGETGCVAGIHEQSGKRRVVVEFDGHAVDYDDAGARSLMLAYACTIHKAQGSEYPAVVIPVVSEHAFMLSRNLLYTAVTRGKAVVVLVGTRKALQYAVWNDRPVVRCTALGEMLADAPLPSPGNPRYVHTMGETGVPRQTTHPLPTHAKQRRRSCATSDDRRPG